MEQFIKELLVAVEEGDIEGAVKSALNAVEKNKVDPLDYFENCLAPAMNELGDQFSRMEIFLPDLMVAGEIADAVREELVKKLDSGQDSNKGKIVIGTISGDNHDIGKKMVATMLGVNGYEIIDLGTDVDPMDFINTARKEKADIIAMSSLLSTSMPFISETIEYLGAMGLKDSVKVVVGGGPISAEWAQEVGADGYGHDAKQAVDMVDALLS
jgi:methylmalonyl-CoA mutase cobalamin-binding domain/chain